MIDCLNLQRFEQRTLKEIVEKESNARHIMHCCKELTFGNVSYHCLCLVFTKRQPQSHSQKINQLVCIDLTR